MRRSGARPSRLARSRLMWTLTRQQQLGHYFAFPVHMWAGRIFVGAPIEAPQALPSVPALSPGASNSHQIDADIVAFDAALLSIIHMLQPSTRAIVTHANQTRLVALLTPPHTTTTTTTTTATTTATTARSHWPFGKVYCKISNFIAILSIAASVFTLTAISCDRYVYWRHLAGSRAVPKDQRLSVINALV